MVIMSITALVPFADDVAGSFAPSMLTVFAVFNETDCCDTVDGLTCRLLARMDVATKSAQEAFVNVGFAEPLVHFLECLA